MESYRRSAMAAAMHRLLHKLKDFVRIYGRTPEDEVKMPDYDVAWVAGVRDGEGPDAAILEALKATPAIWVQALPEEVCIVPRKQLQVICQNVDIAEMLASEGMMIVESRAAKHLYEMEERERAQRSLQSR